MLGSGAGAHHPRLSSSVIGVLEGPLLGLLDGAVLVSLPGIRNFLVQRIVQVGERHQGLNGEEDRSDLESGGPLVLQDVEADSAKLVDVWVVDLGSEEHFWWDHGILIGQEELAVEDAALIGSLTWSGDLDEEVSWVLLVGLSINANIWVLRKSLCFLFSNKYVTR